MVRTIRFLKVTIKFNCFFKQLKGYSKIYRLTSEFHGKVYAKNRFRMNHEAMSTISVLRVKFTLDFNTLAMDFSCTA